MKLFLLFFLLLTCSPPASPKLSGEGELCDICIDLVKPNDDSGDDDDGDDDGGDDDALQVTLLEEWITEETTADEIAAFVEQFCSQLGPLASVCEVAVH